VQDLNAHDARGGNDMDSHLRWTGVVLAVGFAVAVLGSVAAVQVPQARDANEGEYVDIDGGRNPELIPAWLVWETSFRTLAIARRDGSVEIPATIGLSDADLDAVMAEAEKQSTRDDECAARVERLNPMVGREKAEIINEKTEAIQLECRAATLQARDRLFRVLTPEDGTLLVGWVNERKRGIQVRIRRAELAHFRRPE
jgi:hypothetical protein